MTEDGKTSSDIAVGYPPQRHILRDLQISLEFPRKRRGRVSAPVVPAICTEHGGVHVGIVATLVDVLGGGLVVRSIYPDWLATSNLSVYTRRPVTSGFVTARGSVLRTGRTTVVVEVDIFHETSDSAMLAESMGSATMTFSRLPRRKTTMEIPNESPGKIVFGTEGSGLSRSFLDEIGLQVVDSVAGVLELEMSAYVRNSFHALQGGVVALLTDVAGQQAASVAAGKPMTTRDLTINYLAQGKIGPIRTKASVIRTTTDTALTRVEVIDTGANNRLLTVGMNTAMLAETG
ncbi:MAG: PaaI family thioesterase [Dehalococcoidia bacterium]|nr:MAG: PaaI family thioesterase [Dehalococcoidia bacterium]